MNNNHKLSRPEKLPLDFWSHPLWKDHYKATEDLVAVTSADDYDNTQRIFSELPEATKEFLVKSLVEGRVNTLTSAVFALPVLSEAACSWILQRSKLYEFKENIECEDEEYRIPEVVLQEQDPVFYDQVGFALTRFLCPWFAMIWNAQPNKINTIQIAKYNPKERSGGNWHIDRDSDFTSVISLSPGSFTGGGTEIANGPFSSVTVPALPTGYALVFDGKRTYHQGCPVLDGDRDLLVIWAEKEVKDD